MPRNRSTFISHLMAYEAFEVVTTLSRLFVVSAVGSVLDPKQIGLASRAFFVPASRGVAATGAALISSVLPAVLRRALFAH